MRCLERGLIKEYFFFKNIDSKDGKSCSGKVFCIYLSPEQFLEHQGRALELMERASNDLKDWGAEVIGLGGLTGVAGSRGKELNDKISIPVTSGNSFTIYSSIKALERIIRVVGADLRDQRIVVIGFPGSIALAIAEILAKKGANLLLVSKRQTSFLKQFLSSINDETDADIEVTNSIDEALNKSKIILTATSTGGIIDAGKLKPGTMVIDIAQPRDVIEQRNMRKDILIVDGGIVSLPDNGKTYCRLFGWQANDIPGCLGETIILALENRREAFSIGRNLSVEKIEEIGRLGEKHGFTADNLRYFKKSISDSHIKTFSKSFKTTN